MWFYWCIPSGVLGVQGSLGYIIASSSSTWTMKNPVWENEIKLPYPTPTNTYMITIRLEMHDSCSPQHWWKTLYFCIRNMGVVQPRMCCCAIIKEFLNWRLNWNVVINIREWPTFFFVLKENSFLKICSPLWWDFKMSFSGSIHGWVLALQHFSAACALIWQPLFRWCQQEESVGTAMAPASLSVSWKEHGRVKLCF